MNESSSGECREGGRARCSDKESSCHFLTAFVVRRRLRWMAAAASPLLKYSNQLPARQLVGGQFSQLLVVEGVKMVTKTKRGWDYLEKTLPC